LVIARSYRIRGNHDRSYLLLQRIADPALGQIIYYEGIVMDSMGMDCLDTSKTWCNPVACLVLPGRERDRRNCAGAKEFQASPPPLWFLVARRSSSPKSKHSKSESYFHCSTDHTDRSYTHFGLHDRLL